MPDQPQNNETVLSPEEIEALPAGAVVRDSDGDIYTRVTPDQKRNDNDWKVNEKTWPSSVAEEIAEYSPVTLVSLPNQPDLYQQARIALRDVLGMEPDEQMILNTMQAHRPRITTLHETAASVVEASKPMEQEQHQPAARHVDMSGLLDADFGVVVFVKDNDVAGLARLRAHAALDALLDQHGISR